MCFEQEARKEETTEKHDLRLDILLDALYTIFVLLLHILTSGQQFPAAFHLFHSIITAIELVRWKKTDVICTKRANNGFSKC